MVNKKIKIVLFLFLVVTWLVPFNQIKAASCGWQVLVFDQNANVVNSGSSIPNILSTNANKTQILIKGGSACSDRYFDGLFSFYDGTKSDTKTLFNKTKLRVSGLDYTYRISLGSAKPAEYTYELREFTKTGTDTYHLEKTITEKIKFTDSSGKLPTDTKSTNTTSDGSTSTSGNQSGQASGSQGLDASKIDTDVTYDKIVDFDQSLGTFFNPLGDEVDTLPEIIAQAIRIMLALVAGLSVLVIIYGSFFLVFNQGNQNNIYKGKSIIIGAVIGLVVSLLSFTIVALVQRVI
ncbi:MAG: pilin [Candidatus Doudnabacteria bacterium]